MNLLFEKRCCRWVWGGSSSFVLDVELHWLFSLKVTLWMSQPWDPGFSLPPTCLVELVQRNTPPSAARGAAKETHYKWVQLLLKQLWSLQLCESKLHGLQRMVRWCCRFCCAVLTGLPWPAGI